MSSAETFLGARRIVVPANGLAFEIFEAGEGDRIALLLHGFPQHAVMWRHLVGALVQKGYRVWAVNQRGYGGTSRPAGKENYSLAALTGDIAALIDASGARETTLIGHDWGGFIAWVFAIRRLRPLERLVCINIPHPLCFRQALEAGLRQKLKSAYAAFFQIPFLPDWLLSAGRGHLTGVLLQKGGGGRAAIPEEILDIYRNNAAAPGATTAMLNWYRSAGADIMDATDLDAPMATPTLVIWGVEDVALGEACLEGTERYVCHLRIEKLPGVTHFSPEDAPERVAALIDSFL